MAVSNLDIYLRLQRKSRVTVLRQVRLVLTVAVCSVTRVVRARPLRLDIVRAIFARGPALGLSLRKVPDYAAWAARRGFRRDRLCRCLVFDVGHLVACPSGTHTKVILVDVVLAPLSSSGPLCAASEGLWPILRDGPGVLSLQNDAVYTVSRIRHLRACGSVLTWGLLHSADLVFIANGAAGPIGQHNNEPLKVRVVHLHVTATAAVDIIPVRRCREAIEDRKRSFATIGGVSGLGYANNSRLWLIIARIRRSTGFWASNEEVGDGAGTLGLLGASHTVLPVCITRETHGPCVAIHFDRSRLRDILPGRVSEQHDGDEISTIREGCATVNPTGSQMCVFALPTRKVKSPSL